MYYKRILEPDIHSSIRNFPVTAILGPRQCGKSTLAKQIISSYTGALYLDLERESDLRKLDDAEWYFSRTKGSLVCLDEIQRKPDLFPILRSVCDEWGGNGHFLLLGSASRDVLKQSSETLAGRINYKKLSPFLWEEIKNDFNIERYLNGGGFPRSLLAENETVSFEWRESFVGTFLERDLLLWSGFSPSTMRRLWSMLAHINGQLVNYSRLAQSLDVSGVTVKNYINLLADTFMVTVLPPYVSNRGKRLLKSPKIYINDTGVCNALLGIHSFDQLMGHPVIGSIWETMVLVNLKNHFPRCDYSFYRSGHGAEIDIVMEYGDRTVALECRASKSPALSRGTHSAVEDINPLKTFIIAPVDECFRLKNGVEVMDLSGAINAIGEIFLR